MLYLRRGCEAPQEKRWQATDYCKTHNIEKLQENFKPTFELGELDGKVPRLSLTNFVNNSDPLHLNWSTVIFRKRITNNGEQSRLATEPSSQEANAMIEILCDKLNIRGGAVL